MDMPFTSSAYDALQNATPDFARWEPLGRFYAAQYPTGLYCMKSFLWFLLPLTDARVPADRPGDLIIGDAGHAEITLRQHQFGIYAYHPGQDRYDHIAPDLPAYVNGWRMGQLQF